MIEKGCPFNSFGPCRGEQCMFFLGLDTDNPYAQCAVHAMLWHSVEGHDAALETLSVLTQAPFFSELSQGQKERYEESIRRKGGAMLQWRDALSERFGDKEKG